MKRILLVLLFTGAAAMAMPTPISDLPTSCTHAGATCTKTYDVTSGVCRTIRFATSAGEIQVQACDKVDRYELYRQSVPSSGTFKVCVGGGSVDGVSGFSSFTSTTLGSGCTPPAETQGPQPLVSPDSTGFANEARADNHKRLLDAWWNNTAVVQRFECAPDVTCAWVPWYASSSECTDGYLKPPSVCGGTGAASATNNCTVTDQFSQVFLATAQGTAEYEGRLKELIVRELKRVVERAVLTYGPGGTLHEHHVRALLAAPGSPQRDAAEPAVPLHAQRDALTRDLILRMLRETDGNKSEAALRLGMSRNGLLKAMRRLRL